jgi:2-dehydro-3-deoxyphosphogluconate aldolase/(4S)-4-hydroxy-2-oxoglutarate aldolase
MTADITRKLDAAAARAPVVPVIVIDTADSAGDLARALQDAGITIAEVTLRTPEALKAITAMRKAAPELLVGAGTVLTSSQVRQSLEAGAEFLVSPGLCSGLREAVKGREPVLIPGVATASEAMMRAEEGFERLKLFPAAVAGGQGALKAFAGPLPGLRFMPTGGISENELPGYLKLPNVFAVGGSWIASHEAIASRDWLRITATARRLLASVG